MRGAGQSAYVNAPLARAYVAGGEGTHGKHEHAVSRRSQRALIRRKRDGTVVLMLPVMM